MGYPYVPAKHMGGKRGNPTLIVIHDMEAPEGPLTAENVARYFQTVQRTASAHYCIDNDSVVQSVPDDRIAYAAPGANTNGLHFEMAGYARQSREEWLDPYSARVIFLTAAVVAEKCKAYGIPRRWIGAAELRSGQTGITSHREVTAAFKRSTHIDPGANFPIDQFMNVVNASFAGEPQTCPPPAAPPPPPDLAKLAPFVQWAEQQPVIKLGSRGESVRLLQTSLNAIIGSTVLSDDGVFGQKTHDVVVTYQRDRGLTSDGVVGVQTWARISLERFAQV